MLMYKSKGVKMNCIVSLLLIIKEVYTSSATIGIITVEMQSKLNEFYFRSPVKRQSKPVGVVCSNILKYLIQACDQKHIMGSKDI